MERLIPVLMVVAFLAAWWWFLYRRSNHYLYGPRMHSPIWMAFSTTAAAALFLIAGSIGYTLDTRARFFAGTSWSDTVIWWEVGVGLALVPLALYFWRKGSREVDRRLGRA